MFYHLGMVEADQRFVRLVNKGPGKRPLPPKRPSGGVDRAPALSGSSALPAETSLAHDPTAPGEGYGWDQICAMENVCGF